MAMVTVIKLNPQREETWRYSGQVLSRDAESVLLEALFNRADLPFHGMLLRQGDRFLERYSTRHWYNIFEIHDREDDHLKGWYCNVALPAELDGDVVRYVDLALDLLVFPDGRRLVLDEDEFAALSLEEDVRQKARQALSELQALPWGSAFLL